MKAALIVLGGLTLLAVGRPVRYAVKLYWMRGELPSLQEKALVAVLACLEEFA